MTTPARIWREKHQRYRLEAGRCRGCGKVFFPPRRICDACGSRDFEAATLPETGKLITYTVIHTAPTAFEDESPYAMGIVEMADGTRLFSQIADVQPEELTVGLPVRVEFRKIQSVGQAGVLCYGYKFVPDAAD